MPRNDSPGKGGKDLEQQQQAATDRMARLLVEMEKGEQELNRLGQSIREAGKALADGVKKRSQTVAYTNAQQLEYEVRNEAIQDRLAALQKDVEETDALIAGAVEEAAKNK